MSLDEITIVTSGQYHVYLQPVTDEECLPENTSYDARNVRLFSNGNFFSDAGRFCEKGKTVKLLFKLTIPILFSIFHQNKFSQKMCIKSVKDIDKIILSS